MRLRSVSDPSVVVVSRYDELGDSMANLIYPTSPLLDGHFAEEHASFAEGLPC